MKKILGLFLVMFSAGVYLPTPAATPNANATAGKGSLATITGSVLDNKGNPVTGAVISLLKDGANKIIKQTRSDSAGRFTARISPGRYGLRAIANGFNEVVFSSIEVRASQELIYRFNLEPVGSGKTLPEQRKDRDDVKWSLRSTHSRRSIFQAQEGEDADIQAALGNESLPTDTTPTDDATAVVEPDTQVVRVNSERQMQGVVETYFAGNSFGPGYSGLNFAVSIPATEGVEFIFAGQTSPGASAPERLEISTQFRAGERHRLGMQVGAVRFGQPVWTTSKDQELTRVGQFSVRAIDEWIVRDGIVVVFGVDYAKFLGAGGAQSINPRFGIQFDANARTRLKAAYAPGGDEDRSQSVAAFESSQVVFRDPDKRPVAFVNGLAVMEQSRRLEFGVERVIDDKSSLEGTAFFDTTIGRGVGLLSTPMTAFSGPAGEAFINVANQQGASRGVRLVYTRRLSKVWTASAGYSFGRGQRLAEDFSDPAGVFENWFFQTGALQLGAGFGSGTNIRTVLRFSPNATVFAIDPFAGRLAVYDPSLSIQVTQELPSFGLPVRAEAVIDARNLLDFQASSDNGEVLTQVSTGRRSFRGGISVRF